MSSVPASQTNVSRLDKIRERELFRYYQPSDPDKEANIANNRQNPSASTQGHSSQKQPASPDITLTALAQLCALRLKASRAMISVIGKETQYFITESTKTLDLIDNRKSEKGDELWIGCAQVGKEGRLCEKTIALKPILGKFPCFTVTDLSKDSRFNRLPFISGPPFFKFYAGTPLTTKKGINIGSLFILDDVVRPPLTDDQETFLGSVGQSIMKHMEINREAQERQKAMQMSRGLNAFVEGRDRIRAESVLHAPDDYIDTLNPWTQYADDPPAFSKPSVDEAPVCPNGTAQSLGSSKHKKSPSDQDTSQDESGPATPPGQVKDSGHQSTFVRAANLLRESLDLKNQGGVVYLDAVAGFNDQDDDLLTNSLRLYENGKGETGSKSDLPSLEIRRPSVFSDSTLLGDSALSDNPEARKTPRTAKVISFSPDEPISSFQGQTQVQKLFSPLSENHLKRLIQNFPCGKIWSFDEDGGLSSSEEEPSLKNTTTSNSRRFGDKRKQLNVKFLQEFFPAVRQLLFVPLWDSSLSRWFSGCFVWSTSNLTVFSSESELSFLRAFNNSVMAEVSRLASIAADRQKGDFIGSISHELRSPLHGILASAEFLSETESDAFQISLIDTISSCGRTLLDTINHVLDFSKINTFERNWHNARKPGIRSKRAMQGVASASKEAPPLMNIYAITDLAAVTEEVIEGVYVGQVFQDISTSDILDVSSKPRHRIFGRSFESKSGQSIGGLGAMKNVEKDVEILLDFAHGDFTFSTQPGALRRIVMNIFGNALKYTTKGIIRVKIRLHEIDRSTYEQAGMSMFEFKVEDTGKGITSEYLRTKLYTPFCQEDVLASGTGLGLSIVRSIVIMLNGSIDVRSQVGKGTEITVCIPLMRASGTESTSSTPNTVTSVFSSSENSINILREEYPEICVALFGFDGDLNSTSQASEQGRILNHYISDWFGLKVITVSSFSAPPDVIILNESHLSGLLESYNAPKSIVVLCDKLSRRPRERSSHLNETCVVEYVSTPFGPYKIAKATYSCLKRMNNLGSMSLPNAISPEESPASSALGADISSLASLTLKPQEGNKPINVQTNGVITVGETLNAQMAVDNLSSNNTERRPSIIEGHGFPFPSQKGTDNEVRNPSDRGRLDPKRPNLSHRATEPWRRISSLFPDPVVQEAETSISSVDPGPSDHITPNVPVSPKGKQPPRLLLVDDNRINLRLLETYMRKNKYDMVDTAENGEIAVKAAELHPEGYDIIFMDISMPIMNGFEATRRIRELESARNRLSPALIIALTGLASSRDQAEAFTSGIDLFMTKPVSFREVGQLLDNWEANGGTVEG